MKFNVADKVKIIAPDNYYDFYDGAKGVIIDIYYKPILYIVRLDNKDVIGVDEEYLEKRN